MNWHKALLGGLAAAVMAGVTPVFAAGEKDPEAEIIKQLFDLGEGCKAVVDPATGELKVVYIVGSAPISRSLNAPEALRQAGIAYATEQIIDLLSWGVAGIHIYTMNKPEIAQDIMKNIGVVREALEQWPKETPL